MQINAMGRFLSAIALVFAISDVSFSQEESVEELILKLNTKVFSNREKTHLDLLNMGSKIRADLIKGLNHPEPEIARHLSEILIDPGMDALADVAKIAFSRGPEIQVAHALKTLKKAKIAAMPVIKKYITSEDTDFRAAAQIIATETINETPSATAVLASEIENELFRFHNRVSVKRGEISVVRLQLERHPEQQQMHIAEITRLHKNMIDMADDREKISGLSEPLMRAAHDSLQEHDPIADHFDSASIRDNELKLHIRLFYLDLPGRSRLEMAWDLAEADPKESTSLLIEIFKKYPDMLHPFPSLLVLIKQCGAAKNPEFIKAAESTIQHISRPAMEKIYRLANANE